MLSALPVLSAPASTAIALGMVAAVVALVAGALQLCRRIWCGGDETWAQ